MLKAYSVYEPSKWDDYLPYVFFAYREVPNETIGFTPFELLYARHVRGPLDILKEQWVEPTEEQASVISYISYGKSRKNGRCTTDGGRGRNADRKESKEILHQEG